jgi:hypothetical protein
MRIRTAAVRYHNGSVSNLVKVEGSSEYKALMRDVVSEDIDLTSPSALRESHQKTLRFTSSGAEEEVRTIIGNILSALKAKAEAYLSHTLDSAIVTFPTGLHERQVHGALRYAGIQPLGEDVSHLSLVPASAAAAASGIGLCDSYTELDICDVEEAHLPDSRVLAIEYTGASLTVSLAPFQASRSSFDWMLRRDWDLGADSLPTTPEESKLYWSQVRDKIQELPLAVSRKSITHVLLMGEAALDETFLETMRDALHDVLPDELVSRAADCGAIFVDPTFAAARGAAEFAKRDMEAPHGCVERAYCKLWRKWIG